MIGGTAAPAVIPWRLPPPDSDAQPPDYVEALAHIYGYSERPRSPDEVALSRERKLPRMRALLGLLGSPQGGFESVLVAGSKGKGSTAAMLASMLSEAGHRVGRYTQPHLYSFCERIWACGRHVTRQEVVEELEQLLSPLEAVARVESELGALTTFDVGTAQAFVHFARAGVEVAVVEVGVGGANDATNVLEPVLSIIGPIGLDHTATLGPTLARIATEKAGVARQGAELVVAAQEPEAMEPIRAAAGRIGAPLYVLGEQFSWAAADCCGGEFAVSGPMASMTDLSMPLVGIFQRDNASAAVSAAQLLDRGGWAVPEEAIRRGLANVHWPGRFQTVMREPLTIVDGAHNPAATRALAATVRDCLANRPLTLVLGMSAEKDVRSSLAELAPLAERTIVTRARHTRAMDPDSLADVVRELGGEPVVESRPAEAVIRSWELTPPGGATLVTGSLFLVGDVLEWLLEVAP